MKKLSIEDINKILNLLDDPNEKIFEIIEPQLTYNGQEFYLYYKEYIKTCENFIVKNRLKKVIEKIYFKNIEEYFRKIPVLENEDIDLEEASFLLSTLSYPEIDIKSYKNQLDSFANEISERIKEIKEPKDIIKEINKFLFTEKGFHGNNIDYTDTNNTYINMVIDRKTGIPITLSAIYLFITKRLNLPVYGVGMPGHFILKYKDDNYETFIDPFYGGQLLSKQDCINFLIFSGYGFLERYLDVSSNKEVFKRMLRNLLLIYKEENDDDKYDKLRDLLSIVDINY